MSNNSNRTQLTTANLVAHTTAFNITEPTSNNDDNIRRAAIELGFEMPSGWQGNQTYGKLPMERYLNSRDDPYALSGSNEIKEEKGNQRPNL
ncbi:uncharacterized protein LTHEOB_1020 [Lasiodiplodia theobromae]|uniref:uncharacterized protein n=1 Tax=Lasiodiplodia theobromae TaxID=45133 RepID=UPI0015C3706C|nr:uncharacterized protein LTHEOB_1020 [Lasiodiplodia theobromae]KAF4538666.1 hypothetical protein LTHEOB_1020 [Lasiodiplodia theobromae]